MEKRMERHSIFSVVGRSNNQLLSGAEPDLIAIYTMQIRKNQITGDEYELLVAGRIDGEGANQLEVEILSAIRGGAKVIYVNLSEANFLCSAGIRVLLQYWRQLKNQQRVLLVTRPSPAVDAVLETTGFKEQLVEKV